MRLFILFLFSAIGFCSTAQQTVHIAVTSGENKTPVAANITIRSVHKTYFTDNTGRVSIPFASNGNYFLTITAVGYEENETRITVPYSHDTLTIELDKAEHELEEVIVQSTRTSRTIANVPTRVETIELEEIEEKSNMRPGNIAMLLHESTGIQVQQTSATSANASIRIQGLDGRYTQLLKDGFANFGNFSSGLSVLEIPPLDLKQVEVIKGPASPLFGGGAIAGVINFISKTPGDRPAYNFILNQSNIGQSNIGGFASGKGKKLGYTMLALYNRQNAFDVDKDDFTELPQSNEYTLHPKLFIYAGEKTTMILGNSFTKGERTGGDIQVIKNNADAFHQYFEKNKTLRNISSFELDTRLSEKKGLMVKQSFSIFNRSIDIRSYRFAGIDHIVYTDVSYISNGDKHAFVLGGNFVYNNFREKESSSNNRDNRLKNNWCLRTAYLGCR